MENFHKDKSWHVYMLLCDQKTFYIGISDNPTERLTEHRAGKSLHTKKFSDLRFVYYEKYSSKHKAALRVWDFYITQREIFSLIQAIPKRTVRRRPGTVPPWVTQGDPRKLNVSQQPRKWRREQSLLRRR